MPTDLNILKKAFQNATSSYEAAKPWEEPLTRRGSVHADQNFSAPVIPGDVGAWVASGGYPYQSIKRLPSSLYGYETQDGVMPPARNYHETNPGSAGLPDVDFVAYNWGTNRFGNKGGALLGHPISYEVVGPTGKSPYTHWQWAVDSVTNTIQLEAGVLTATFTGGVVPTVADAYGLDTVTGISTYNGGLYVLVTFTGSETLDGSLVAPGTGITPLGYTYQHELFRVKSYQLAGQKIVLDSAKPLFDYFSIPLVNAKIKTITLLRPKVTRLAAFPLHDIINGERNQVFVFLPPETAANSELMPPYNGGGSPDWSTVGIGGVLGESIAYGTPSLLPIPLPTFRATGVVHTAAPGLLNQWSVNITSLPPGTSITAGQVLRVRTLTRDTLTEADAPHTFGWFESKDSTAVPGVINLRRVPEVDLNTGEVFYGNGPISTSGNDTLEIEVYDNIGTIFTDPVLNVRKVMAARLDHLIDPRSAQYQFTTAFNDINPSTGVTPPGPAIFDTVSGSKNPGNLTKLGFRVVLFPATLVGGVIAPDFDNPIQTDSQVLLDPSQPSVPQYIEVDYDAGIIYLSHPPRPDLPDCAVAPNGIIADAVNNPRNEVVLYASCVPYSREETQRGGGLRVKSTRVESAANPMGPHDATDVYGERNFIEIDPASYGAFTNGSDIRILTPSVAPPPTGRLQFVEVDPTTHRATSFSSLGQYGYYDAASSKLLNVSLSATPYTISATTRILLVKGPWQEYPLPNLLLADSTRGSSKRADAINFKGGRTLLEADGSVTVKTTTTLDDAYRANDPSAPGAGRTIRMDGGAVDFQVPLVFPLALAGPTALTPTFTVDVTGNTVTTTDLTAKFWTSSPGPIARTLLEFNLDVIEIEGVQYVASFYGPTGKDILILNTDGTTPNLTLTGVVASMYRPRFYSSRGDSVTSSQNFNSWFTGQKDSLTGALNIFAGSATAISPGDGGGTTAALVFWSRYMVDLFGSFFDVNLPLNYFDTFGRFNSIQTPVFMSGAAGPDYAFRGDYATRVDKTIAPASVLYTYFPTFGHIVEDYSYDRFRYDFFSMFPLNTTGTTYSATVTLAGALPSTPTKIEVTTVIFYERIPYGSAVLELLDVNGDTTKRGLYLVVAGGPSGVVPNTYLWILTLNGIGGVFPGAIADTLTFKLHYTNSIGKRLDAPYLDPITLLPVAHSPTQNLGVGFETNAAGLVISGPARIGVIPAAGENRHAYRVTTATDGSGTGISNVEVAALDLDGYHKAADYLYLASRTVTKQLNTQLFQPINTAIRWDFVDASGWWASSGNSHTIKIPLDLPRSSARTDSAGAQTHRTRLVSITVNGQFHGGAVGSAAHVHIYRVFFAGAAPPTRTQLYLGPAAAVQTYLLPFAGADTTTSIAVWEDAAATLPVYIDDTASTYYYIEVTSASASGNADLLYGVRVTYTDPGPRNY